MSLFIYSIYFFLHTKFWFVLVFLGGFVLEILDWTSALRQNRTNKPINKYESTTIKNRINCDLNYFIGRCYKIPNWRSKLDKIDDDIKTFAVEMKWWHERPNNQKKIVIIICKQINLSTHLNKKSENTKMWHRTQKKETRTPKKKETHTKNRKKIVSNKKFRNFVCVVRTIQTTG